MGSEVSHRGSRGRSGAADYLGPPMAPRILVIDNYDSFVYNLVQYLGEAGAEPIVHRHDAVTLEQIIELDPDGAIRRAEPCTCSSPPCCSIGIELDDLFQRERVVTMNDGLGTRLTQILGNRGCKRTSRSCRLPRCAGPSGGQGSARHRCGPSEIPRWLTLCRSPCRTSRRRPAVAVG